MSDDIKQHVKEFQELQIAEGLVEARRKDLALKKLALEEKRTAYLVKQAEQQDREDERAKTIRFGMPTQGYLAQLQKDSADYLEAASHSMVFIHPGVPEFKAAIPNFRKNFIFIGGKTGEGKSTAVANIALQTVFQVNPDTGMPRRVLILTNEERPEDVYNRITFLYKGWAYINHDSFTAEQKRVCHEMMAKWMGGGLIQVIPDFYEGTSGNTTTPEGFETIMENLIRHGDFFDVVIIDYYQKYNRSRLNPKKDMYTVQAEFTTLVDNYKNIYPAPFFVFGQVKPPDEAETPFEIRVKGSKEISVKATVTIEMVADRKMRRTLWTTHKGRFTEMIGQTFQTGFDKGRFVPYTPEFAAAALKAKERKEMEKLQRKKETPNGKEESLEKAGQKGEEVAVQETKESPKA